MKTIEKILIFSLTISMIFCAVSPCASAVGNNDFDYIKYPAEAVSEFSEKILERISSGDDYISNRGYDETSLYISPCWSMNVNGTFVPVYATAVYDWVLDRGVVQSFQYIFADENSPLNVELKFLSGEVKNVCVLPEKYGVKADTDGRKITAELKEKGAYTFLINNDSQEYAVTVFVKENTDEDAEIDAYREEYGAENVAVFESGYYEAETIPTDKSVLYFKRGSFVSFSHKTDIRSDADAESAALPPVLELNGKENAVIAGCGTLDFTRIDRRERNLVTVNFCKNSMIDGLILLNPNSWTVTCYACESCTVSGITVFGYRTNSDGINICGCSDMTVENCFCRNGDDSFSAKATNEFYECRDITFKNCIGWSNKARCFGITGEVERDIYRITFTDCAVIFRNANWDTDRTASLAVAVETGGKNVSDILFENIEIHTDTGRPIYCMIYGSEITDCNVSNIVFRNININCGEKIKISSRRGMNFKEKICSFFDRKINSSCLKNLKTFKLISEWLKRNYVSSNSVKVTFENVMINGKKIVRPCRKYFENEGNIIVSVL